jgi:hypothetical protein
MMGRHNRDQGQLLYSFNLNAAVPGDHLVREIATGARMLKWGVPLEWAQTAIRVESCCRG